jgi:hypothetical protein
MGPSGEWRTTPKALWWNTSKEGKNSKVDEFAKAAAYNMPLSADVFFQVLPDPSIKTIDVEPKVINLTEGEDWRAPILVYFCHYYEPNSATEHIRMQQRANAYQIIDNDLYKTSAFDPSWAVSARPKVMSYSQKFKQESTEAT